MRRGAVKKSPPVERRKKSRNKAPSKLKAVGSQEHCVHCSKGLIGEEQALFVEEEINRVFCSEACITGYFGPEIERLEKEYTRRLVPSDLSGEEREHLAHLRFITLKEPDEVWREKTLTGDYRYVMIAEFQPGNRTVWSICLCLFLHGEPSFLFMAFTTKNAAMVNAYRRGERVEWERTRKRKPAAEGNDAAAPEGVSDRLADAWTEEETFLAQVNQERKGDDIPPEEFEAFQSCIEQTLETPDEVWSMELAETEGIHLYHFIKHYLDEKTPYWYVILARETEDEEQIEIIDAFPTRDSQLVERYRRGAQEVGETSEEQAMGRVVH
ncbi:PBECR2 nuclease fold domain-containing protein [Bdellovibrionota bacterium FG-1]